MRTIVTATVSLLLGLVLGWYLQEHRARREETRSIQQSGRSAELGEIATRATEESARQSGEAQSDGRISAEEAMVVIRRDMPEHGHDPNRSEFLPTIWTNGCWWATVIHGLAWGDDTTYMVSGNGLILKKISGK